MERDVHLMSAQRLDPAVRQQIDAIDKIGDVVLLRRLTADRADYDRTEGVIMFDGRVRLANEAYHLTADRAFAFVRGTNDLRRIVAVGNVAVTNGARAGYCDRTVYSRSDSRLVMYAGENAPARLVDADDGRRREVAGQRISFYLDSEQVEVVRPVMTVEAGKEDFRL
jgi:lipopolysaccharide transport protein LptA